MASLPTLAYVYDPLSFAPFSITEAAEGVCRLVWVVDHSKPDARTTARLLRKFGPVVDSSALVANARPRLVSVRWMSRTSS